MIGILGILLALAGPNLTGYVQRLRFNESTRTFSEALLQARDTATRGSIGVTFEAEGGSAEWVDEAGNRLGGVSLPHEVELETPVTVRFSGRGLPLAQAQFGLSNSRFDSDVWLLPTGAILR